MNRLANVYPDPSNPAPIVQNNTELTDARLWDRTAETSAASITLDFSNEKTRTLTLAHNVTFDGTNYADGRRIRVRIVDSGSGQTLAFDASWVFLGSTPAAIAAGKTALLELECFGLTAADVIARYWVEP